MTRAPIAKTVTEAQTLNAALGDLSIEELIRKRVSIMLVRLGDAPIADLYELVMRETERGLLGLMLDRCRGNRGQAAAQLGLHRNTLRQKLDRLALLPSEHGSDQADRAQVARRAGR